MQSDDSFSYSYFPVIQFYDYGNEIKQKLSIGYGKELPIGRTNTRRRKVCVARTYAAQIPAHNTR